MRTFAVFLDFYMFISARPFDATAAAAACRKFLILYSSLRNSDDGTWHISPKFHMLQELAEHQCTELDMSPEEFWTYKDEDFVGWVATFSASRGGAINASSEGLRVINRYRAWVRDLRS